MDTGVEKLIAYYALNWSKASVVINLKSAGGREILYKLAKRVDVFIESFQPSVQKRFEIDYGTL